jgi:hypothetical protein
MLKRKIRNRIQSRAARSRYATSRRRQFAAFAPQPLEPRLALDAVGLGLALSATEGKSATFSVGIFTTHDSGPPASSVFSASIDWGDGSAPTSASITLHGQVYTISGTHTYADETSGTLSPSATITDSSDQTTSLAVGTATVADARLTILDKAFNGVEGATLNKAVASFTDANASAAASDFTASIVWGDLTTTAGTATANASGGFDVSGTHSYADEGTYTFTVNVTDVGGSAASATAVAHITDAALSASGRTITPQEGATFSGAVASFTDANGGATAGDFTASIVWGDGATTTGTVTTNAGGGFDVTGEHLYADEGTEKLVVSIADLGGAGATVHSTAQVGDAPLTSTGATLATTEGQSLSGVLASFTDDNSSAPLTDFIARIGWGDGQTTTGTITANASGGFDVSGTHAFAEAGTHTIAVAISDVGGSTTTTTSSVEVSDASLTASGTTIAPYEGTVYGGALAAFNDANPLSTSADFTATIAWGDGTTTAGGVGAALGGGFQVTSDRVYGEEGSSTITVTVMDAGGATVTAQTAINIADAPLTLQGANLSFTEGQTFSGGVGIFSDANTVATASDFTANIVWGDGATTLGTVSAGAGGGFVVSGSHAYADEGVKTITAVVNDAGGSTATILSLANVGDAAISATGSTIAPTEGTTFSGPVASFTDADPGATSADFTATIVWGDRTTNTATVTANANGGFDISGSHVYGEEGTASVVVSVFDAGGAKATVHSVADIADAPLSISSAALAPTEGQTVAGTIATFTDADSAGTQRDYAAIIDWGDGNTTAASVGAVANGGFVVDGAHAYADEGPQTITVTVSDAGGSVATAQQVVNVADAPLSLAGGSVSATEAVVYTGPVATFIDDNPSATGADFSATIDWGDGTVAPGTISLGGRGVFTIAGSHAYADETASTIVVTLADDGGAQATAMSTAAVSDAALMGTGTTFSTVETESFSGLVGSFTDDNPTSTADDFSATVDWGDGVVSLAQITANAQGGFDINATHAYPEEGTAGVIITVTDVGGAAVSFESVADIGDAPLTATASVISLTQGTTFSGQVATFVDAAPAILGNYTAAIDWGDSNTTAGTVSANADGTFAVTGSHIYATAGNPTVVVSIQDYGGEAATASSQATIGDANARFAAAAYDDVLDRNVDPASLAQWDKQLNGGLSRAVVADTIDHSDEYFASLINPAYDTYLGRTADAAGLQYWVAKMRAGLTDEQLEAGFIASAEFYIHAGGTDLKWVDSLFQDLLGRPADQQGEQYWTARLKSGESRADVALGFTSSIERERQRIAADYLHYLGRATDQQGLDYWTQKFATGVTNEDLITGFVAANEYFQRHTSG